MKMLKPASRFLKLRKIYEEEQKQEMSLLLPEDYKPPTQRYTMMILEAVGSGCTFFQEANLENTAVLVDETMVERYKDSNGQEHYFILENHVMGVENDC